MRIHAYTTIILGKLFLHVVISMETCESARARSASTSRNAFIVRNTHIHVHVDIYAYFIYLHTYFTNLRIRMHARTPDQIYISDRLTRRCYSSRMRYLFSSAFRGVSRISGKRRPCVYFTNAAGNVWNHTRSDNHPSMIARGCTFPRLHSFHCVFYMLCVKTNWSLGDSPTGLSAVLLLCD